MPSELSPKLSNLLHLSGSPLDLLGIRRGSEKIYKTSYEPRLLEPDRIDDINALFADENLDIRKIEKILDKELFYGIYADNQLVSFANTLFRYPPVVMLDNGYVRRSYRGRGLLRALVSFILEDLLHRRNFGEVQIYTAKDNMPVQKTFANHGAVLIKEFQKFHVNYSS